MKGPGAGCWQSLGFITLGSNESELWHILVLAVCCVNCALGRSLYKPVFWGGCDNWHSREQQDDGFHSNGGEEMAPFYQHLHNSMANETAGCLLRKYLSVICRWMFYGRISIF